MLQAWVIITLCAAFIQTGRTAMQRKLTDRLSADEASYVRFCFALPFAVIYVAALAAAGYDIPVPHAGFFGYIAIGAVGQILGTVALIRAFGYRNFAVGIAYSKTEAVQTVVFGFIVLGELVGLIAFGGILVSLVGVLLLSFPDGFKAKADAAPNDGLGPATWLGIGSGAGFAFSAVCFRAASTSLEGEFFVTAAVTLLGTLVIQTLVMGVYMRVRDKESLPRVFSAWRWGVPVGLFGMAASSCWFTAMTLERAAYVRAVGQIELLFAFIVTLLIFRERVRAREVIGSILLVLGIVLLLLW